jgi:hypothetical protein
MPPILDALHEIDLQDGTTTRATLINTEEAAFEAMESDAGQFLTLDPVTIVLSRLTENSSRNPPDAKPLETSPHETFHGALKHR